MAIYHAQLTIVKRSANRSVIAAAAYRSGERLIDERDGEIHDYTRRSGVDDKFIMAPSGVPSWASNRSTLWNAVEVVENRCNSQLAREFNVALPLELSKAENKELLHDWVQSSFVDKGMVADVAMHDMDSGNPHAHILLTTRELDEDGFVRTKNRDWGTRETLIQWRKDWESVTNEHLEQHGRDERIDSRSLKAQGVERQPTIHLGPHASAMEKQGIETERGNLNRDIEESNSILEKALSVYEAATTEVQEIMAYEAKQEKSTAIQKARVDTARRIARGDSPLSQKLAERRERSMQAASLEVPADVRRTQGAPSPEEVLSAQSSGSSSSGSDGGEGLSRLAVARQARAERLAQDGASSPAPESGEERARSSHRGAAVISSGGGGSGGGGRGGMRLGDSDKDKEWEERKRELRKTPEGRKRLREIERERGIDL